MATETKHDKFLRLAEARVGKTLEDLRLVGQLSSNNYENTQDEADEIIETLRDKVNEVADLFGVQTVVQVPAQQELPLQEEEAQDEPVEPVHQPEEPEVVFPPPVRFTSAQMHFTSTVDPDDIRSALQLLTYSKDVEGAVKVLLSSITPK